MLEDLSERTELIASISSQVAEGVGPLISQIVEKRFREEKQTGPKTPSLQVPTLSHPGLNAQAYLLSKWIADIEQIETIQEPDERKERMAALKKNLKRRLTTVVGADSDAAIFHLADAYEKVEAVIDQSDEFGKAVAEHLKKTATIKSQDAQREQSSISPFGKAGIPGAQGHPPALFCSSQTHLASHSQLDQVSPNLLCSPPPHISHPRPTTCLLNTQSLEKGIIHSIVARQSDDSLSPRFPGPVTIADKGATSLPLVLSQRKHSEFRAEEPPLQATCPENRKSAFDNHSFVDHNIEELLEVGAIETVESKPTIVSPPAVAKDRKLRIILDLSWLNKFVVKETIRFEDIAKAWDMLKTAKYLCTFDMKSGYHHVPVHAHFKTYFGFHWSNRYFVFKVLPFGFCSPPFIFTKLFKPLLAKWRKFGIDICLYLDDGIVCGESASEVNKAVHVICQDFVEAGVTLSYEKCCLTPQNRGTWLGYVMDLERRELSSTEERTKKAVRRLESMRCSKFPTLRERLKLLGTLNSMWFILESEPQLYTRALNDSILSSHAPLDRHVPLNPDEELELQYWEERFATGEFVKKFDAKEPHPSVIIFSDASSSGLGAVLHTPFHREETSSNIPPEYRTESSTFRELLEVKYAIDVWKNFVKDVDVELRVDNKNVTFE